MQVIESLLYSAIAFSDNTTSLLIPHYFFLIIKCKYDLMNCALSDFGKMHFQFQFCAVRRQVLYSDGIIFCGDYYKQETLQVSKQLREHYIICMTQYLNCG